MYFIPVTEFSFEANFFKHWLSSEITLKKKLTNKTTLLGHVTLPSGKP